MRKIGFAGLGLMGSRMAARLVARGHDVTVWDMDEPNVEKLVALGARAAADPAGITRDADTIVTMLWDDEVAAAIVEAQLIPAARPGTTFIEMTTITPRMQRRLAHAARERRCAFLDAPVTGSIEHAERGELTTLVGGEAADLESRRDVLETLAAKIVHVGPNGSSGALKLANNHLIALMMAVWGESIAIAREGGVDWEVALPMFAGTFGRVAEMKRQSLLDGDVSPHFTVDALVKDLRQLIGSPEGRGANLDLLQAALPLYERALTDGHARDDFSVVVRLAAGLPVHPALSA